MNREISIVFVDFSKAFDSINIDNMLLILQLYDFPDKLLNELKPCMVFRGRERVPWEEIG